MNIHSFVRSQTDISITLRKPYNWFIKYNSQTNLFCFNQISSTKRAIKAISLLILLSHSIKFFNVKWHTNKTRRVLYRFHRSSNLNSDFDSSLTSLISANFVSLTDCYELSWVWQRKGDMWEEWRLKAA